LLSEDIRVITNGNVTVAHLVEEQSLRDGLT